jgi:hypothetical protein
MSVGVMEMVFYSEIPDLEYKYMAMPRDGTKEVERTKKVSAPAAKSVLLAYADHANHEGKGAYPGISRLIVKTGLSHVSVIDVTKALVAHGYLVPNGVSSLLTNDYAINVEKLLSTQNKQYSRYYDPSKENQPEPEPVQEIDSELVPLLEELGLSTKEPSTSDLRRASTLRAMRRGEENAKDRLAIDGLPAHVDALLNEFANAWKHVPTKGQKSFWIKEANEWLEIGINVSDIKPMYEYCLNANTAIASPKSITWAYYQLENATTSYEIKTSSTERNKQKWAKS